VFQDGTKKKFQTLQFFLLGSKKNPEFFAAGKKFSNPPNFFKPPPRRRKNLQFPPIFFTKVFPRKKFFRGQFDPSVIEIEKNYAEEKFFPSAPTLWEKILQGFEKNFLRRKKFLPLSKLNGKNRQEFFLRFPFNNFKYYFTLLSKFFSSFLHSTFSLSVFCQYLALDELHHPF